MLDLLDAYIFYRLNLFLRRNCNYTYSKDIHEPVLLWLSMLAFPCMLWVKLRVKKNSPTKQQVCMGVENKGTGNSKLNDSHKSYFDYIGALMSSAATKITHLLANSGFSLDSKSSRFCLKPSKLTLYEMLFHYLL